MTLVTCALGPDSAGTLITGALRKARQHVDAIVYEVGPAYRWAFVDAARRGVAVRLLLDHHPSDGNQDTAVEVRAAGGECRVLARGAAEAHAKLLLLDRDLVAVGTGNLIWRDAPRDPHGLLPPRSGWLSGTREWWVLVSRSPALAETARSRLEAIWSVATLPPPEWEPATATAAPAVGTPRPQVAPLVVGTAPDRLGLTIGGSAVRDLLTDRISGAQRRVLVTLPYVSSAAPEVPALLGALAAAQTRGADVRVLLGTAPRHGGRQPAQERAIPLRCMDASRSTLGHAKGLVVDDAAIVSSANWSSAGLGRNVEAALVVDQPDAAAYYADAWARDWASASELSQRLRAEGGGYARRRGNHGSDRA